MGWNSTLPLLLRFPQFLYVSIPNGMEFYLGAIVASRLLNGCFNSQWDGILRYWKKLRNLKMIVSIPNGMEFYYFFTRSRCENLPGFNSQRDGILPCVSSPRSIKTASFNSQRDGILLLKNELYVRTEFGFNSQRDGILQFRSIQQGLSDHVSIPNGMEFYLRGFK